MPKYWQLVAGGSMEPCEDRRHVGLPVVRSRSEVGQVMLSTIFLGADHSGDQGKPAFFETLVSIRGSRQTEVLARYATFREALFGHSVYAGEVFGTSHHTTAYGPVRLVASGVSSDITPAPLNQEA